jgi:transcriptional regulator GlxA family with amidase domain
MTEDYIIAIPIYNDVDLMDLAAPFEIFQWMAGNWQEKRVQLHLVAETSSLVSTRGGGAVPGILLQPHMVFDEVPQVDLLWIPGGAPDALVAQMKNPAYIDFIRSRSEHAQYVTSVCEGALIAADAGLLDGYKVTTHWAFIECLRQNYPAVQVSEGYPRFVHDRNRVTGGGISSGLDEAIYLVQLIAGQEIAKAVQVAMQYFPSPPVHGTITPATGCMLAGKIPVNKPR